MQKDVPKAEPKSSQLPTAEAAPPPRAVRGYGGPGLVEVRVNVARMQAASAPQPPSPTSSATSAGLPSPSSPESPDTVQHEGRRTEEQKRKDEAAAGTGEGEDKGGQAEASRGRTEVVAAEAEGQGEEQGQQAVVRRRADPFNLAESDRKGGSVVNDILVVSEDEGEEARRMAVEGGPGQLAAPNVPAAAMKSILSEVRRKEEGKGRRGRPAAGAAESGDSSVRTRWQGRTGKGGKRHAGASGARHATPHQEGKGGKGGGQGRQCPQPQCSFKQLPPGSPTQVSVAVRAEEEREARRQQAAGYEALAHMERQRCRNQPPDLPAGDGVRKGRARVPGWTEGVGRGAQRTTQWRAAERGRAGRTEQRSGGGAHMPAGGGAREWEPATWTGTARCRAGMRD